MRKRRKRWTILMFFGLMLCLGGIYHLSSCMEVAYIVHFTNFVNRHQPNPVDGSNPDRPCQCAAEPEPSVPKCEVIHVAIVCAGYESSARLATLVKSLLFHRQNPIHLHLIVDSPVAGPILKRLFDTWNLPALQVSFYSTSEVESDVSWIPNRHYSGVYGLLKLTLPKILPQNLSRVLVVDTDILFVSDVSEIWKHWRHFKSTNAVGLVENQSNWYLGKLWKNQNPWPALGRGFNTGVILMDLDKLRLRNWMQLWRIETETQLREQQHTALADQDIFNSVIKRQPELVYALPCEFNLQLGDRAMHDLCETSVAELKVVHWNSPHKTKVKSRYAEFFRRHHQTFLEMDGNLLRRELLHCPNVTLDNTWQLGTEEQYDEDYDEDGCYEFRRARNIVYRTQLYARQFQYNTKEADVTLVAQLSVDRLQMLVRVLEHWDGPASIALYVSDAEARQLRLFLDESPVLSRRTDVAYHLLFKEGAFFPVNALRNVALEQVQTPFVYLSDIDFLPMFGLYDILRTAVSQDSMERKAFVVPAFETQRYRLNFPRSKADLLNLLDTGQLFVFRQDVWAKGHTATDYDKWRTAASPYPVGWRADFEPYIVVSKDVPRYDRRFLGFGWNKVSHIMQLDALGYDFVVLPNAFMIHLPHAPSFEIAKYRSSAQYRRCLKIIKGEFMKDLAKQSNTRSLIVHAMTLNNKTVENQSS